MIHQQQQQAGPPHAVLFAIVISLVLIVPFLVGEQGEAITGAFADIISPIGLLLLPVVLLLIIQFLSSGQGNLVASVFSSGEPDTIHRVSGSPVGVALFLLLTLVLLNYRVSIFGGDDDSE